MAHVQLQFDWLKPASSTPADTRDIESLPESTPSMPDPALELPVTTEPATFHHADVLTASLPDSNAPPIAKPLQQAVAAAVFGLTEEGPIDPDEEEGAAITSEHAHEMIVVLSDLQAVIEGVRTGCDPRTGRVPKTSDTQRRLADHLQSEERRLTEAYANAVAAYAEAFGDESAKVLDDWVRKTVADDGQQIHSYEPTHPWHYYHAGDNAVPVPLDQIPIDLDAGQFLESDLPKNRAKRIVALRERFERERQQLEADKHRYEAIVEHGAEALSRYDREIAHTSDAMARASALALKYRHVSLGLGRVQWIQQELRRMGDTTLFTDSSAAKTTV